MSTLMTYYDTNQAHPYAGTLIIHAVVPRDLDPREVSRAGLLAQTALAPFRDDSGHAWVELIDTEGKRHTWSTWGKELVFPRLGIRHGVGLCRDRELDLERIQEFATGRENWIHESRLHVRRGKDITPSQLDAALRQEKLFLSKGERAFSKLFPCSHFSAVFWANVTGERLHDRAMGLLSAPSLLAQHVLKLNERDLRRERDWGLEMER